MKKNTINKANLVIEILRTRSELSADQIIAESEKLVSYIEKEDELSPYNPIHSEIPVNPNPDCCGIFNRVNDTGEIICNECGMLLSDALGMNRKETPAEDQ